MGDRLREICWVCHRRKGPGKLSFAPLFGVGDVSLGHTIPIHGGHRVTTIIKAGLTPRLVPKEIA